MNTERPPLEAAAFRAVCAYAVAHVILPDDVIRLAAGLRAREPFVIDVSRVERSFHLGKRFRSVLAELYRGDTRKFDAAAPKVCGRIRTYFAHTRAEIESTGSSNDAGQIPGTPWWVSINNGERLRSTILDSVMTEMGFSYDYRRMLRRFYLRRAGELPSQYVRALSKLPNA